MCCNGCIDEELQHEREMEEEGQRSKEEPRYVML
jgi:hypothetical protein